MSDVFISYKRENLAAVHRLVEALRAEGVAVWWDQDIPPNAPWEATIERELAAAKLVIVAWSPASVASDNVKAEARWARGQGRLLQVFVAACEPPLFFGERQGVDLKDWSGGATDPAFRALLQAVRAGPAPPPADTPAPLPALAWPGKPSIAVMPFANLSGDPEQEYFADGMVAEITNALCRIKSLFVVASSSALTFKGKVVSAQEAASQLGVRYVLEGSVRRAASRVRIAVQLVDATDGAQIWTHRFDDTLEDVFDLQDRVATSVAGVIGPAVNQAEFRRASKRPTENMNSYDLYLRALGTVYTYLRDDVLRALDLVNRALELDPDYGPALGLAAGFHQLIYLFGWGKDLEADRRQAIDMAHRAARAASDDADVLALSAEVICALGGEVDAGLALADRAIALNAGSAAVWQNSGAVRLFSGDADLALQHFETSMRLDPIGRDRTMRLILMTTALFHQGRYVETAALAREAIQQADNPGPYALLAATCGLQGQTEAALEALNRYRALSDLPVAGFARQIFRDPAIYSRFMAGVAMAEGKASSEDTAGGA
jgi:adenylate cyclase